VDTERSAGDDLVLSGGDSAVLCCAVLRCAALSVLCCVVLRCPPDWELSLLLIALDVSVAVAVDRLWKQAGARCGSGEADAAAPVHAHTQQHTGHHPGGKGGWWPQPAQACNRISTPDSSTANALDLKS
jgi:hypothetical protein